MNMATNENVFPVEENRMHTEQDIADRSGMYVFDKKHSILPKGSSFAAQFHTQRATNTLKQQTRPQRDSSVRKTNNAIGGGAVEKNFFESVFASHRFGKDVEELTHCRNSTFLPHASVDFNLCNQKSTGVNNYPEQMDSSEGSSPSKNRQLSTIYCAIEPFEGAYAGIMWEFQLDIPSSYPFRPPEIRALDRLFHPNVDMATGQVALKVLGSDWSPVLTLRAVVLSLVLLFVEPNLESVYNEHAAQMLRLDPSQFHSRVKLNIQNVSEQRSQSQHCFHRGNKRGVVAETTGAFHVKERPKQRAHLNPSALSGKVSGKRQSECDMDTEQPTQHLAEKLSDCQLGGPKRRKILNSCKHVQGI